jgi:hypothetical protein
MRDVERNFTPNVLWEVVPARDGSYYLLDQRHQRALTAGEQSRARPEALFSGDLDNIVEAAKTGDNRAMWRMVPIAGDLFQIQEASGIRRSLIGPNSSADAPILQIPVRGQAAEWRLIVSNSAGGNNFVTPTSERYWTIRAAASRPWERDAYLGVRNGEYGDGEPIVVVDNATLGTAQFRFVPAGDGGFRIRVRDNGKILRCTNAGSPRLARFVIGGSGTDDAAELFRLVPAPRGRWRIALAADPRYQIKAGGTSGLAVGDFADFIGPSTPGAQFEIEPAARYVSPMKRDLVIRFNDEPFDYTRAIISGMVSLGANQIPLPGASAVLGFAFGALWPDKKQMSYDVMARFRDDLLQDVAERMADTEFTRTRTQLQITLRDYLIDYVTTKRSGIDDEDGHAQSTIARIDGLATGFKNATAGLTPTLDWTDPVSKENAALMAAGLPGYLTARVHHLNAVAESMMLQSFNTKRATRSYLRHNGRVLTASATSGAIAADGTALNAEGALELVPIDRGALRSGDTLSLRASNGTFVSAWTDAPYEITAIAASAGSRERFRVERVGADGTFVAGDVRHGDSVVLTTYNERTVQAAGGGGGAVTASGTNRAAWETFVIERQLGAGIVRSGDNVHLKIGTRYIGAVDGGGGKVSAASPNHAGWETFVAERHGISAVLSHGMRVALRRRLPTVRWVSAQDAGGTTVGAVADHLAGWEKFTIESAVTDRTLADGDPIALRTANGYYVTVTADGAFRADGTSAAHASFALAVAPPPGGAAVTAATIEGFASIITEHETEARSTIEKMLASLILLRRNDITIDSRTWEKKVNKAGQTWWETHYAKALVDKRRPKKLFDVEGKGPYDDPHFGEAALAQTRDHAEWEFREVTYAVADTLRLFGDVSSSTKATCTRLAAETDACTRFRYEAILAGIVQ